MYGSMMAGGIAAAFLFQMFVNIGMTIGIMPVTGIPLPFISYGGAAHDHVPHARGSARGDPPASDNDQDYRGRLGQ